MLKVTVLTCAIMAAQPLIGAAQAGDAVPGAPPALSLVWTGRFISVTKAPVLAGVAAPAAVKPARPAERDDVDVVGSIPIKPAGDIGWNPAGSRSARTAALCVLPGVSPDRAADDLACNGAQQNRWSVRTVNFNYDLAAVNSAFANAPAPYAMGWE